MITEKRLLPIGVEYDGSIHRELEIEPRRVAHMIDALEDERSRKSTGHHEVCMLACQVTKLGSIPKHEITGDLLMSMYAQDYEVLAEAADTAQKRVEGFRPGEKGKQTSTLQPPNQAQKEMKLRQVVLALMRLGFRYPEVRRMYARDIDSWLQAQTELVNPTPQKQRVRRKR